jgi:PAS domain S-box-containing protein
VNALRRWVAPPPSVDDEGEAQAAQIFHRVTLTMVAFATPLLVLIPLIQLDVLPRAAMALLVIDGLGLGLLEANRRGHTTLASHLLIGGLVALVTVLAFTAGGIRSPGVTMYFIFVLMSGLLLGQRQAIGVAVICAALSLVLVLVERAGALPAQRAVYGPGTLWLLNCLYIAVTLALLRIATGALARSLQRAKAELAVRRAAQRDLAERVKELRLLNATAQLLRNRPYDRSLVEDLVVMIPPAFMYSDVCEARIVVHDVEVTTPGWRDGPWQLSGCLDSSSGAGVIEVRYTEDRGFAGRDPFLIEERALIDCLCEMVVGYLERDQAERRRRATENQLARSESYLKEGERLSHTGSFGVDVATGQFTYVSAEIRRLFGYAPDAPPPSRPEFVERIHPEDRARVVSQLEASIAEKRDTQNEFRIVRPDGSIRHVYSTRHPVLDATGRVVELLGTTMDITDRKLAEEKLARTRRLVRERALEARFAAALEERTRLAREIHDSLLQGVTGIALQLRATLPRLKGASEATTTSISEVVELAESTIRDARRAVWDMRAPSLVQKGLATALEEAIQRAAGRVPLQFRIVGRARTLRPEAEDTIFRVGQEAVVNAARHAAARSIAVTLTYKTRGATLEVVDDGRGFQVEQAFRAYAGHWGLLGMRERADRIGANMTISSTPGRGTTVELQVPIPRSAKAR